MNKKELYKKYKEEKGVRVVSKYVFYDYLIIYGGYEKTISFLNKPKNTPNNKKGKFKRKNIQEIVDFAKLLGIEKTALEFDISERSVYRYINNQKK